MVSCPSVVRISADPWRGGGVRERRDVKDLFGPCEALPFWSWSWGCLSFVALVLLLSLSLLGCMYILRCYTRDGFVFLFCGFRSAEGSLGNVEVTGEVAFQNYW